MIVVSDASPLIGLAAVGLVEAKQSGHLTAVRPVIEALTLQAGFHVSEQLTQRVLEVVGE